MYTPGSFHVADGEGVRSFLRENSFGLLLSSHNGTIEETFTSMFLSEDGKMLHGHIARANPQWRQWAAAPRLKAIFSGPHAYVSPRFYAGGFNVPTWNYTAVVVAGTVAIVEDLAEQKEFIHRLTAIHEAGFPDPWRLDESDERMMKLFDAIVCFRIAVETIEAKFKLNQNKTPEDRAGVIAGLKQSGDPMAVQVAALMEQVASRPSERIRGLIP